ncbi:MAG: hypothetical protein QOD44_2575 [Solirubrobacteraceae bacterium]|jgi:hypothetical protein|nr:hypothetical protein [Solirubrobacteraceae bacterium]
MRRLALAACLTAALSLAGCGGSDTGDARKAAEAYVKKLGARDGAGTCGQMTKSLQRQFTDAVARSNSQFRGRSCAAVMQAALDMIPGDQLRQFSDAKIEGLKVKGDGGTFQYRLASIKVAGKVAKEDGDWKVSCCVPSAGG